MMVVGHYSARSQAQITHVAVIACYNTARCLTIDDATSAGCVSMHLTNISPHISIEFKMFD